MLNRHLSTLGSSKNFDEFQKLLAKSDPQKTNKGTWLKGLPHLVSKKKRRFSDKKYDLDLAYITDRVIAMGFPSEGLEAIYRNKIKIIKKFLDEHHQGQYKIYNLCSERYYEAKQFEGRVERYPFDDHNCPTLNQMIDFCKDLDAWLNAHERNVGVVHCKAGKGRTGLMICAFLLYRYSDKIDAEKALQFFAMRRTKDSKGVTIRSQQRFVKYFEMMMINNLSLEKLSEPKRLSSIIISTAFGDDNQEKTKSFSFILTIKKTESTDVLTSDVKTVGSNTKTVRYDLCDVKVSGSVKLEVFYHAKPLCSCWIHPGLIQSNEIKLFRDELDGKPKSTPKKFDPLFFVSFRFQNSVPDRFEEDELNYGSQMSRLPRKLYSSLSLVTDKKITLPEERDILNHKIISDKIDSMQSALIKEWNSEVVLWHRMRAKWMLDVEETVQLDFCVCFYGDGSFEVLKTLSIDDARIGKQYKAAVTNEEFQKLMNLRNIVIDKLPPDLLLSGRIFKKYLAEGIDPEIWKYEKPMWTHETMILPAPNPFVFEIAPELYEEDKKIEPNDLDKCWDEVLSLFTNSRFIAKVYKPSKYVRDHDQYTLNPEGNKS